MLIPKEILDGVNEMISFEMTAIKQYLIIGTRLTEMGFPKLGGKFFGDVKEEQEHAFKEIEYIIKVGGKVEFLPEKPVKDDFKSVEEIIKTALELETNYFKFQNELIKKAKDLKDSLTEHFLVWFLENQVKEIGEYQELLHKLQMIGKERLFMLEQFA